MATQQELSRRADERETAVVPLDQINVSDLGAGRKAIDDWLRSISGGYITLDRLLTVAGALPIVGNVLAAIDAVCDVIALIKNRSQSTAETLLDWVSLGINLIGIIPIPPGTAAARMSLRPALHLVRSKLKQAGADLGEAVVVLLADHLNATIAGEIDKFVQGAKAKLPGVLDECGKMAQGLAGSMSGALRRLATGQVFDTTVVPEPPRHDPEARYASLWGAIGWFRDTAVRTAQGAANAVGGAVMQHTGLGAEAGRQLQHWAGRLDALGADAKQKLKGLGDAGTSMTIGWLLARLEAAVLRFAARKRPGMANVNASTTARHDRQKGEGQLEGRNNELVKGVGEANRCKNCAKDATGGSIRFATGSETLLHTDFSLPGHLPIVWQRCYHSRLGACDHPRHRAGRIDTAQPAYLGARWTTPYTTRIEQQPDGSLHYLAADGRTHRFPALAGPVDGQPGQTHHDPIEDLTLGRGNDGLLILSHGRELVETFELAPAFWRKGRPQTARRHVHYRLAGQRDRDGHAITLAYRHEDGQLSDIVSAEAHVSTAVDVQGRIRSLWLVQDGRAVRQLAAYAYDESADGSSDLVAAEDENGERWQYAYLPEADNGAAAAAASSTHLLARYTDRTGRAIHLQWMHEDGFDVPLRAAHGAQARAWHERAEDGSFETTLVWNRHIRLVTIIDALGAETRHYFDHQGYTYRIVHPVVEASDGRRFEHEEWFFRDASKNIVKHLHPDGTQDRYAYDARGNLVSHIRPDDSVVHFAWDAMDNLTGILDAEGHAWQRRYDGHHLVEETDPLGHKTRYANDAHGLPVEITDAKGGKKKLAYDAAGQLTAYTDCSGKTSRWAYDARGRLVKATNAAGETTQYHYGDGDPADGDGGDGGIPGAARRGQLARIVHPDGTQERFAHDAEGRLLAHRDALQRETRYAYGPAGLIDQRMDANRHTVDYDWDRLGRLVALHNENGRVHRFSYDAADRLLAETHFDGARTRYRYTPETGVLHQIEQGDALTQFAFDPMGRLLGREAMLLVAAGDGQDGQARSADRKSLRQERYAYDGNGRLVDARNADVHLQWHHDPVGNVHTEHHHYLFDARGRRSGQALTAVWRHRYDELGERIETVRPDGHRLGWLRYGSGHVHGLMLDETEALQIERDDLHREVLRTQGNRLAEARRYDPAGRLAAQVLRAVGAGAGAGENPRTFQLTRRYEYDRAGQLSAIADSRRGALSYRYDPVGRLLQAHARLGTETFAFDPASNMLDTAEAASSGSSSSPARTPAILDNLIRDYAGTHYDYDARGQMVRRLRNGEATRFKWDAFGRMTEAYTREVRTLFAYDPLGRRILKRSEPTLIDSDDFEGTPAWRQAYWREMRERGLGATVYGWDGDQLAWESDTRHARTLHYVFEPGGFVPLVQAATAQRMTEVLLARPAQATATYAGDGGLYDLDLDPLYSGEYAPGLDDEGEPPPPLQDIHYYQCDHLGTPMELTDAHGEIAWEAHYKAWGEAQLTISEAAKKAGLKNPIRFQGQYFDEETGLHYNRYRYYDPHSGRFTSKDPIGLLGGLNLHQYASNSNEWIDPLGLAGNRANRRAGQILQDQQAASGGHAYSRHGAHTTMPQQEHRAITGIPPDNPCPRRPRPINSTRFLSNVDQLDAIQRATQAMERNGTDAETIDMGRAIGEGYRAGGGCPATTTKARVVRGPNGIVTAYPILPPP